MPNGWWAAPLTPRRDTPPAGSQGSCRTCLQMLQAPPHMVKCHTNYAPKHWKVFDHAKMSPILGGMAKHSRFSPPCTISMNSSQCLQPELKLPLDFGQLPMIAAMRASFSQVDLRCGLSPNCCLNIFRAFLGFTPLMWSTCTGFSCSSSIRWRTVGLAARNCCTRWATTTTKNKQKTEPFLRALTLDWR